MAVLDYIDNDYVPEESIYLTRENREYVKSRLPVMPFGEIAEHLGINKVTLRLALRACGIFMASQREYDPTILYCTACERANVIKAMKNGVCRYCIREAREMQKLDKADEAKARRAAKKEATTKRVVEERQDGMFSGVKNQSRLHLAHKYQNKESK